MLEKLTYINHLNERFELGTGGVYVNTHELRNYEWSVTKQNDRITGLKRGVAKKKLPVVFLSKTAAESYVLRDRFFEIVDKDAAAQEYGKLIIGDYYLRCYVTKSIKKQWMKSLTGRFLQLDLTVTTDRPAWVKETRHVLRKLSESGYGGQDLDYPFDYAFDFKRDTGAEGVNNTGIVESNFRMIFYGPCVDPEVEIGGHLYRVYGEVETGEYVTIDSAAKTIYLTREDGTQVSWLNNRYRRSYIFQPIKVGKQSVFWGGNYGVDVITYDERSEPRWT